MKIGIYGTGVVGQIVYDKAREHGVDVSFFVQTNPDHDKFKGIPVVKPISIDYVNIDYLVLGSDVYRHEMMNSLSDDDKAFEQNKKRIIDFDAFVDIVEPESDYRISKVDKGINYIYTKYDTEIGPTMAKTKRNWAADDIDALIKFAQNKAGLSLGGLFLDIGANIGTTSIYVNKMWPEFKVIAFEPGKQNYDLFRVNCILNDAEACHIENIGLGDSKSEGFLFYRSYNPGGSMIVEEESEISREHVCIDTLDNYISRNGIDPQEVSFIWIDTEGFEAEVIIGSKALLAQKRIPLVQEFDPKLYIQKDKVTEYLQIMKGTYKFFFDVNNKKDDKFIIKPIAELDGLINEDQQKTDLFFF